MQGEGIALATDRASMLEEHLAAWRNKRPRIFWVGLALAFLVHVLFIVGIGSARQRDLGTPDGAHDAIAVEIVDGATLKDSMEQPTPVTAPPGTQQQTAALPSQQPPPPPPPEPQVEPQPPAEAAQPSPPAEVAEPAPAPAETPAPPKEAPKPPTAEALPAMEDAPVGETTPQPPPEAAKPKQPAAKQPAAKPQAKPQPKPKPRTQTSALDLSVPYDGSASDGDAGGSSAVQRPPGITRSGENDEFARNVIRALQKTMPRENARGRVTVRIVLNANGSRADVKLLQSGGNADLDFNVMFAARGTAYPFPPKNATLVDRTFTVTYIYR